MTVGKLQKSFNARPSRWERADFNNAVNAGGYAAVAEFIKIYGRGVVDERDSYGRTALMCAALYGRKSIVKLLLDNGARIDNSNSDGWTALMYAAENGHSGTIKLLLARGGAIDKKSKVGKTALMFAAAQGHGDAMNVLLEHGADINAKSNNGMTALMYAARKGLTLIVKDLLERGAIADELDQRNMTARKWARQDGYLDTAEFLDQWHLTFVAQKEAQWLKNTDCSQGVPDAVPVPRPFKIIRYLR